MTGRAILYMITHRHRARMTQGGVGVIDILESRIWPGRAALRIQPFDDGEDPWLARSTSEALELISSATTPGTMRARAMGVGAW